MCKKNTGDNKSLLEEYKELASKAMKTPADTEELIELDEYIIKQKDTGIKELESRLQDSVKRVKFLVSYFRCYCYTGNLVISNVRLDFIERIKIKIQIFK